MTSMNAGTPASRAPGVSVLGMISSAMVATVSFWWGFSARSAPARARWWTVRSIAEEAGTLRPQLPAERAQRGVRRERRIRNRRKGRTETEHEIGPLFSTTKADRILLVEVRLGWTPPGATFQTQSEDAIWPGEIVLGSQPHAP